MLGLLILLIFACSFGELIFERLDFFLKLRDNIFDLNLNLVIIDLLLLFSISFSIHISPSIESLYLSISDIISACFFHFYFHHFLLHFVLIKESKWS